MFVHSCSRSYHERAIVKKTPYALLNNSVFIWLQKEDADEDKSRTTTGREFQAAGPQTSETA